MKTIKVEDSVGTVLAHDITRIVPGQFKGVAYKKGHIIKEEDIPELKKLGKEHLYIFDLPENMLHENDAALRISNVLAGDGISLTKPKEGKIELIAAYEGLLKINVELLKAINQIEQVVVGTLHNNLPVKKGRNVAATRIIPLVIEENKIRKVEAIGNKIVSVLPYKRLKIGIITTGNEVYHGLIKDSFGSVLQEKAKEYQCNIIKQVIVPDEVEKIVSTLKSFMSTEFDIILATGGMSVDPDDVTPTAITALGAEIITYGAPVLPGAMFLYAKAPNGVPILGLPGCVMYSKRTIFDLVLPRILAGEDLSREDFYNLGHGGLCMNCPDCRFPNCSFGK